MTYAKVGDPAGGDGFSTFGLVNGQQIMFTGVGGMTEVNSTEGDYKFYKIRSVDTGANTFILTDTNDVDIDTSAYGTYTSGGKVGPNSGHAALVTHYQQLINTNLPIIFGEFGPGRGIGPSPTMVWPGQIITAANALNVGWLAWAWDDNNLGGGSSNDNSFAMVYTNDSGGGSGYGTGNSADLTIFGKDVVLNPTYGLQPTAVPATIFP